MANAGLFVEIMPAAELKKAIRRRIRTEQNLHKRILSHEPEPITESNRSLNRHDRQVEEIIRRRRAQFSLKY